MCVASTTSGSFQVGDFFKINANGYILKNDDHQAATGPVIKNSSNSIHIFDHSKSGALYDASPQPTYRRNISPRTQLPFEITSLSELTILQPLGQGASGLVQKALHVPSNTLVALKCVPLDVSETKSKSILVELRTLHHSSCPSIVSFYGAFYREQSISLVLEYMNMGSLSDFMKKHGHFTNEAHVATITKQILHGLHYLHQERKLIHRYQSPCTAVMECTESSDDR